MNLTKAVVRKYEIAHSGRSIWYTTINAQTVEFLPSGVVTFSQKDEAGEKLLLALPPGQWLAVREVTE